MNMQKSIEFHEPFKLLILLSPIMLTGCQVDDALKNNAWTWLWIVLPLVGFGLIGLILVFYRRKGQIAAWDLRVSPQEPSAKGIVLWTLTIAGVVAVSFAVYNFLLNNMDNTQKILNIGLWFFGTILGTLLALLFGLRLAEPPVLTVKNSGR